jgi:hypothetical protein
MRLPWPFFRFTSPFYLENKFSNTLISLVLLAFEKVDLYEIRFLKVYKNPHPQGRGYTDKACLRRLKRKSTFTNRIWYYLPKYFGCLTEKTTKSSDPDLGQNSSLSSRRQL